MKEKRWLFSIHYLHLWPKLRCFFASISFSSFPVLWLFPWHFFFFPPLPSFSAGVLWGGGGGGGDKDDGERGGGECVLGGGEGGEGEKKKKEINRLTLTLRLMLTLPMHLYDCKKRKHDAVPTSIKIMPSNWINTLKWKYFLGNSIWKMLFYVIFS